ncbi:MAG: gliding motility-associated C-terminal domain-containing protein [Bacteroidia bacterium]|nr:gliding motility-associated C-terminal domain-containing protein [Bacteroidia bacterium]
MWVQKASLPGLARYEAAAFTLNGKGYFISGGDYNTGNIFNDVWEYDPVNDLWTQKASLPGLARYGASAFSVGNKGYITTGLSSWGSGALNDLWEYDPISNSWTQRANFPGVPRYDACGFSIGQKGYVGFGYPPILKDVFAYDPTTNSWSQIAAFPGSSRQSLSTFEIDGLGYFSCGSNSGTVSYNDLWCYNPSTNSWSQKANFPGAPRYATNGFSLSGKGIIGGGCNNSQSFNDYYIYNPTSDSWCQLLSFPAQARYAGDAFSIGQKGYTGLGRDKLHIYYYDFWELTYIPATFTFQDTACSLDIGFNAQAINPNAFNWSFGDGGISTLSNPSHTYASSGSYNVQLITYYNCGSDTVTQQVQVTNTTTAALALNKTCNEVSFTNHSINATNYLWSFGDGNTSTQTTPVHHYTDTGTYAISLIAYNNNCTDSIATQIKIETAGSNIFIPNCFTPNDDGLNDVFSITGSVCDTFEIMIINRWGFQVAYLNKNNQVWNGKYKNADVPEGIYFYKAKTNGKEFTGTISLLR